MQKYIQRMLTEKTDLQGKIKKAKLAIENPPFGSDKKGLDLLEEQVNAMEQHLSCLNKRLEYERGK